MGEMSGSAPVSPASDPAGAPGTSRVRTQLRLPDSSRMQGNVRLESSASRGRYSTLPVRPALRATRRHAWAETVLPESPASRNWGDKALPRRRHKEERLRSKGGMKSTSEGRRPPAAISGPRVSPDPFSDI